MLKTMANGLRAKLVGVLLVLAFSMLTYTITKNVIAGAVADIISGLAVIGIPLLLFPIFNARKNRLLNLTYLSSKIIEGVLMVIGGIFIFSPALVHFRSAIYDYVHIYFFILGAIFKYLLFYRTQAVPKFISVWGLSASLMLLAATIMKLTGLRSTWIELLLVPIVINEFFLAGWLICRGFGDEVPAYAGNAESPTPSME